MPGWGSTSNAAALRQRVLPRRELRQRCCAVRKTAPLARALVAKGAWITGMRRARSVTRTDVPVEDFDAVHGLPKFNSLAAWSDDDVCAYVRAHAFPATCCTTAATRASASGSEPRTSVRGGALCRPARSRLLRL